MVLYVLMHIVSRYISLHTAAGDAAGTKIRSTGVPKVLHGWFSVPRGGYGSVI